MRYTLMHKDIEVADIEIDTYADSISKIYDVQHFEHLPIGICFHNGICDRADMNNWWNERAIPMARIGIHDVMQVMDIHSTKKLLLYNFGASLSDHYWIRPEGSDLTWKRVNFFDKDFSYDLGELLFNPDFEKSIICASSPDGSTGGYLKKKWIIADGKRCLIKDGTNPTRQQPINEALASKIMDLLGIDHVKYELIYSDERRCSICDNFLTPDTEYVSAWSVMKTQPRQKGVSAYEHFMNCCKELGVPDITSATDKMIVGDYLIGNEDRHFNNFGLIRDANTLEWKGFAPLFDFGNSFYYDRLMDQIKQCKDVPCKPFTKTYDEQLKLVSSFDWIDFSKLREIKMLVADGLAKNNTIQELSEIKRCMFIAEIVEQRVENLQTLAMEQNTKQTENNAPKLSL